MTEFRHVDTKRPNGFYVQFARIVSHDGDASPHDYLFQDADYREQDQARLDAWNSDEWHFIGIQAEARCMLVRNGVGTFYEMKSAGLWAIESDSDSEYLLSVFQDEINALKADIEAMSAPIYEA